MQNNKPVFVHTMQVCCAAGNSADAVFQAAVEGNTGIRADTDMLIEKIPCAIGKIASDTDFNTLLLHTVETVLSQSGLTDLSQTILLVGTSVGGMAWAEKEFIQAQGSYKNIILEKQSVYAVSHTITKQYPFKDVITFSTACTSSANAVVFAKELLEADICSNVLVVGADTLSYTTVNGFHALGVLADSCCRPFDIDRAGMNVAEGIGAVLLSEEPGDIRLAGTGCSSDAYNITHPHPEGTGARQAMLSALKNAAIRPEAIDYINAHGTGTVANDASEGKAIEALFPHQPYTGSTKSITGHTLGACGVIELVISAMALKHATVPGNHNLQTPEMSTLNLPVESVHTPLRYALSNAFAFGGNNVSVILENTAYEN